LPGVEQFFMSPQRNGELDAAIEQCRYWIFSDPNASLAYLIRARAWFAKGWSSHALTDLEVVTRLDPRDAVAWDLLARIRAACAEDNLRDGKESIKAATKACELTEWNKPAYLDTLAAAYAEAGDFDSAVKWQTKAIELESDPKQKEEYRARLKLFQEKKPYREGKR
jgi:tetratricopeptide (TPR) repeat protein